MDGVAGSPGAAAPGSMSSVNPFRIGDDEAYPPFQGDLDEVAVYAYALSAARVQAHYGAR